MTTILHITDLHLLPNPGETFVGVDTFKSLNAVLADALGRLQPAAIIATGDLSQDGSEGSYQRLRRVLLDTGRPVYVLPGNHDDLDVMKAALIGGSIAFEPYFDHDGWRFIMLNSKIEGASDGELAAGQLSLLDECLSSAPGPAAICLHHGPCSPCAHYYCQLRNKDEFGRIVARHGNAQAILAGHTHTENADDFAGAKFFSTPSTCMQVIHTCAPGTEPPAAFIDCHEFSQHRHAYRSLDLHANGNFETHVYWVDNPDMQLATPE